MITFTLYIHFVHPLLSVIQNPLSHSIEYTLYTLYTL